jgi:hypothetical protein
VAISISSEPAPYLDVHGTASENGGGLEGVLEGVLEIGMIIALLLLLTHSIDQKKYKKKRKEGSVSAYLNH